MGTKEENKQKIKRSGCFFAIELVRDPATREGLVPFNAAGADAAPMGEVVAACRERGVWPFAHFNRLQIAPPLIITEEQLHRGLDAVDEALAVADRHVVG